MIVFIKKITAVLVILTFSMFFAVKIYADEYDKDYIESLSSLPKYETSFVPIKLSEPSDFSNDLVNCINVNGELYHISLEYMEKYDGWDDIKKDILSVMDFDNLRIDSYEELRNMIPFGVCVDEYGRNPSPLYQISDDIIILEDYHCKYDKSGNLYHMTTKDEFIGY